MIRIIIITISFLMVAIIMVAAVYAEQYAWKTEIQVSNTSGNEYNGRILFEMPAAALIDGGYMRDDANDVYLSGAYITAMDLSAGTATWSAGYYNIPAGVSKYILKLGSPSMTRNQSWIGADGDNCYAAHDASLSFNSGSSFAINCDVTLVGTPVGECFILGKSGSYELLVDDTPEFIFRAYEVGTSTTSQNLAPNQYISNTCDADGSIPGMFSDSNNATMIYEEHEESCIVGLANPTLPEGLAVGTVTVRAYMMDGVGYTSWVEPALRYDGAWDSGTKMYPNSTWGWQETVFSLDPDGNAWSVEDMSDLELKLTLNGQSFVHVSEVYVKVEGTYSGSPTDVNIPASIDTETHLTGYYINGVIGISDGSMTSSGTISSLNTNSANIHIGEFNGYIDNPRVSVP